MSIILIPTNFNLDIEFESPAFFRRLLSWVIDMIVQVIYLYVAVQAFQAISQSMSDSVDNDYNRWWLMLIMFVPFILYHFICEVTMNGQSIGKKVMGIRVISENGSKPSLGQFIIRWLIRASDVFIFFMILIFPLIQFYSAAIYVGYAGLILFIIADLILVNTRRQQRLGDILAHTLLINTRQKENIEDTIFLSIESSYKPSFPQVMRLSDRDINSLKGILDTARKKHDFDLAQMASEKIKNHLKIDSSLSPFDFLEVLLKDYNYLSAN